MPKEMNASVHFGFIVFLGISIIQLTKAEECILIKADDSYLKRTKETYVNIGKYKIPEKISDSQRLAEVSFKVLVDYQHHDGILLAVGNTPNFKYYEWKKKAVHTVFMVIEFVYSALSVLLKAKGHPYMEQLEIYRTYPIPYNISDGLWHDILVRQENRQWTLSFDNITVTTPVRNTTDISLIDKEVFIGGRPGYLYWQFRGIIKDLHINRRPVNLNEVRTQGKVDIEDCNDSKSQMFEADVSRRIYKPTRTQNRGRGRNRGSRRWSRPPGRR